MNIVAKFLKPFLLQPFRIRLSVTGTNSIIFE